MKIDFCTHFNFWLSVLGGLAAENSNSGLEELGIW